MPGLRKQNVATSSQDTQQGSLVEVKLRPEPSFEKLSDLVKPTVLKRRSDRLQQEDTIRFIFTPEDARQLLFFRVNRGRHGLGYYPVQVHVRFCLLETTSVQDDHFPPKLAVMVNGKPCLVPDSSLETPGDEAREQPKPLDITDLIKLNPFVFNIIKVSWKRNCLRDYVISVSLVKKFN